MMIQSDKPTLSSGKIKRMLLCVVIIAAVVVITVVVAIPIITVITCFIAVAVQYFLIEKPYAALNKLSHITEEISQGNIYVNMPKMSIRNNEIARPFAAVLDIIKRLETLQNNFNEMLKNTGAGKTHYRMEDTTLKGVFAEVTQKINDLASDFEFTLDQFFLPYVLITGDMKVMHINIATRKLMGMEKLGWGEIVGTHVNTFLSADISGNPATIEAFRKTSTEHAELQFKSKLGQLHDFIYYCVTYSFEDGSSGAILLFEDITHIKDIKRHTDKVNAYRNERAKKLTETMVTAIEQGNLAISFAKSESDEDTKEIAKEQDAIETALQKSMAIIKGYVDEINNKLNAIAGGDLTTAIHREYAGDFASIKNAINNISATLHKTIAGIAEATDFLVSEADQISSSSMDLANGAAEQASSIQELNGAIDVINQQTKGYVESINETNTLSNKSTENALKCNDDMTKMLTAMSQIEDSSKNISRIIKVIQDIAFQTNLLALNAAVEAARAGEHGKGFAVVAQEVRNLAARSQSAATETTGLIEDSLERVNMGSVMAKSTAEALNVIVDNANEVLTIISKISSLSQEQAEAVNHVSIGLSQISLVVQNNSAVSEETAATAEQLKAHVDTLRQLEAFFKL